VARIDLARWPTRRILRYAFVMHSKKSCSAIVAAFVLVLTNMVVTNLAAQQAATPSSGANSGELLLQARAYHDPVHLTIAELKALPHITVTIHNSHTDADETYAGVRLADLLGKLGVPLGSELRGKALANYVIATGSDGYQATLALGEIDPAFHPGEVLVADTMDGKPLDAHSGPLKLVVTEDKRPARSVRNLTTIELKSAQ
jgi:hypothetical protein